MQDVFGYNRDMNFDIETILNMRLFVVWNTEDAKTYRRQKRQTLRLLESMRKEEVDYLIKERFVYIRDTDERVLQTLCVPKLKEVEAFDAISARIIKNVRYRWNSESRNELVYRGFSKEETNRLRFPSTGFYFVSQKIDRCDEPLYFVTEKLTSGTLQYHKTVGRSKGNSGKTCVFTETKNKGKIYRLATMRTS